jgi:hypothetical protein
MLQHRSDEKRPLAAAPFTGPSSSSSTGMLEEATGAQHLPAVRALGLHSVDRGFHLNALAGVAVPSPYWKKWLDPHFDTLDLSRRHPLHRELRLRWKAEEFAHLRMVDVPAALVADREFIHFHRFSFLHSRRDRLGGFSPFRVLRHRVSDVSYHFDINKSGVLPHCCERCVGASVKGALVDFCGGRGRSAMFGVF